MITGAFPDEATRDAILALSRAQFPGLEIRSEARIARGAPQGFGEIARAALEALKRMASGSVSFADGALSPKGAVSAASPGDFAAALQALLPAGVALDVSALQSALAQPPAPTAQAPDAAPSCAPDARGLVAQTRIYFDRARQAAAAICARTRAHRTAARSVRGRGRAGLRPHGRNRQPRSQSGAVGRARQSRGAAPARGRGARASHRPGLVRMGQARGLARSERGRSRPQ